MDVDRRWCLFIACDQERCASLQNQHLCKDLKDERDPPCAWTGSEEEDCKERKSVCVHTVCVKALGWKELNWIEHMHGGKTEVTRCGWGQRAERLKISLKENSQDPGPAKKLLLEKWCSCSYMQSRNWDTDVEIKIYGYQGAVEGLGWIGKSGLTYIHYWYYV